MCYQFITGKDHCEFSNEKSTNRESIKMSLEYRAKATRRGKVTANIMKKVMKRGIKCVIF